MKKKKYVKPEIEVIKVEPTKDLMVTSCICHGNYTCDHNNNEHQGPHGNQPICNCDHRPYKILEMDETTN